MPGDPWLERWLPLVCERAGATPVLELGCGSGRDTAQLLSAGLRVVAFTVDRYEHPKALWEVVVGRTEGNA